MGQSLGAGLRENTPCLCGSGRKYKRCHGAQVRRSSFAEVAALVGVGPTCTHISDACSRRGIEPAL
ncbi:SEC-C metal-binding domain-containing protein [Stenotrophomonas maltophilia]|uniref:SEC-C metal-binding domain-containing protein n=1 Tax=Stenotrophomonas maltophilia TaxID=40324 RepID=UPI0040411080